MNSKDDSKKRTICLKSYVTDAEYQHIVEVSERTCLSVSELTRRVLLGHEIRSKVDQQVFLDILKVNADLGRLGGLLKLWLSDETKAPGHEQDVRRVLKQIELRQAELKPLIHKVKCSF
jgi:hypothetical protein